MRQSQEPSSTEAVRAEAPPHPPVRKARVADDREFVCCGVPMEPQLARARDRSGQEFFIAVWCCGRCGKMTY